MKNTPTININFQDWEFQKKSNKELKTFKKDILLLIFSLLFFFLIFEISLRIFSYPTYGFQKGVFVYDEIIGYKPASNYSGVQSIFGRNFELKTNSNGLRDTRDYPYNKSKGTYRILILGDSFSFGNGVDLTESYPEYLRNNFEKENVEIINMGVPGYGINHEYLSFLEEGKKYNPDLVLIQYSPNDWGFHQIIEVEGKEIINKNYSLIANSNGFLVSSGEEGKLRTAHLFLLWNSKAYSFFYSKLRNVLSKIIANYDKSQAGVPPYFEEINSSQYQENYKGYYNLIKKLKDNTKAKIVLFVGPFTSDHVPLEEIKKEYNIDYELNPEQTKRSIEEIAKSLRLSFIDIEANNTEIFLPVDGHWNPKGNKIIADNLYSRLIPMIKK